MLRRVEIKNFRSCKDVVIEIDGDFLVLVGKNGAGKTNLLRAIDWAAGCACSSITLDQDDLRDDQPLEVKLQFDLDSKRYEYAVSVNIARFLISDEPTGLKMVVGEKLLNLDQSGNSSLVFSRVDEVVNIPGRPEPVKIGQESGVLPTVAKIFPADDVFVITTRPVLHFLNVLRYYPLEDEPKLDAAEWYNSSDRMIHGDAYSKWLTQYQSSGDAGASVLLRLLHLAVSNAEEFIILKSMLGEDGLALIDAIIYDPISFPRGDRTGKQNLSETYHFLAFIPSNSSSRSDFGFRFGALSLGTRRIVRILVHMLFDHSSVMLIEQPEDGLHQGMTKKLIGMLKANAAPTQLIISSHSSALLNTLKPEEVRLVTISDGVTSVRSLSAREIEAASNFMNKDGTLSDFFETVQEE